MSRIQKSVAKWFGAFLLSFCSFSYSNAEIVTIPIPGAPGLNITVGTGANALPLQDIRTNPNAVNITTWDDHYNNVPLQFAFPFYGQTFTNSWAATNGYVTFVDPSVSGIYGGCCSGINLSTTTDTRWNYTIFGMHTDLYSWNGQNQYYLSRPNDMTYGWYNLSQCCSSQGGNSFEIKIDSSGLIDTRIAGAMVSWNAVTSGFSGDLAKGEYFQYYHGQGLNITPGSANIFSWQALGGTGSGADQCVINPLYNPSCPGYAAAYLSQQCTISPLYNASCPGYQQAYFTQQCTLNSLYDVNCPGYATAYLNYQCSINPLYSTTCQGYEQAYFDQQCSINGLYSVNCPNYQQAYFADQCNKNGLYSTQCPNYATAYATWLALNTTTNTTSSSNTTTSTAVSTTSVSTSAPTTTISSDGTVSTTVSTTGDSNVDKAITTTTTTTNTAAAPAAPVQLTQPSGTSTPAVAVAVERKQEKQEEKKDASSSSASPTQTTAATTTDDKKSDQPKTARQELQEKREAAAKARAVEDGKNLASNMGKAVDMEQQKMVQNVVIAAMGYTPGFDAYGKVSIVDVIGYKPFTVYNNQKNVDNRRLSYGLFGPTDRLHTEMVDSQYNR